MTKIRQRWLRSAIVMALVLCTGLGAMAHRVSAVDYSVVYDIGSQKADKQAGTWPNWDFATDVDIGSSNWVTVNVVNADCFIGASDPNSGTANAGAIAWYAQLLPAPSPQGYLALAGTLNPVEGSSATGNVTLSTQPGVDDTTHVNVHVKNMEDFTQGNTFKVCVAGA